MFAKIIQSNSIYSWGTCLLNKFPLFLQVPLRRIWFQKTGYNLPFFNLGIGKISGKRFKRALISYIISPFLLKKGDYHNLQFSNFGIAKTIVSVLNDMGFTVDLVEYTDKKFTPIKNYDLFIGHGGYNFESIAQKLSKNTQKIYFSAGPYWKHWNEKEKERIDNLRLRKKVKYPYERQDVSEDWACYHSEAIIALGNNVVGKSYSRFKKVFLLNNASYQDKHHLEVRRDYNKARRNFLFFAGGGNVHKGLDLLLEVFSRLDADLYICQDIDSPFYNVYRHELEDFPNIHLIGRVQMRSKKYYEIVDKCAFLVYPSCADGSPGAVVESLHQGLIPMLSAGATVDVKDFGFMINEVTIPKIKSIVTSVVNLSEEKLQKLARKTYQEAINNYSVEKFTDNLKHIFQSILAKD